MADLSDVRTRSGPVTLGLKIGIGAGEVMAMQVVGMPERREYVVAGSALRQALQAESEIGAGEVRLSSEAEALLYPRSLAQRALSPLDLSVVPNPEAVRSRLSCYLPRPVRGWLGDELHDWLGVLHPMSVLFVGLQGVDYDAAGAVQRLNGAFATVLETVYRYEGTLARLSVDDKGTALLVLFGAPPFSHEDDAARAVRCALDACGAVASETAGRLSATAGAATGHVFAGPVGSPRRREYTVIGSAVNLAMHLMQAAKPGWVLCDYDSYVGARPMCEFESMAPVRVKGRVGPVRVYRPTGRLSTLRGDVFDLTGRREWVDWDPRTLLGREQEVARLRDALDAVQARMSRVLIVQGEAGIGKSRLIVELTRLARERGLTWLAGAGRSVEQRTLYLAWRDVFSYYFGLDAIADVEGKRAQVQTVLWELVPDQMLYVSLLNDVLNLDIPETQQATALDPVLRQQRLTTILLALLKVWAREQPLILIVEDAHWLDSTSWELVARMAHALAMAGEPMLIVLVTRLLEANSVAKRTVTSLHAMRATETLSLHALPPREIIALVTARLGLPAGGLPEPVAGLLEHRSGGNPFFAQELVYALRDQGLIHILPPSGGSTGVRCVVSEDLDRAAGSLPETVQGLILSRIDRLPPDLQLTLRVASVIGNVFARETLDRTLRQVTTLTEGALDRQLEELSALELTPLNSPAPEETYRFKHVITQEVAYRTLLFAQRRAVHRAVAETLEALHPERVEELVGLLAYHWDQAEQCERAIGYMLQAGERAQRAYANRETISHYTRVLDLVDQMSARAPLTDAAAGWRLAALCGLGQVRYGTGELSEANRLFREAIVLGREQGVARSELLRLYHWLGEVLWWQGEREAHVTIAEEALALLGDETGTVEAALVNQTVATGYLGRGDTREYRAFTLKTAEFLDGLPYSEELRPAYTHVVSVYLADRDIDQAVRWLEALERRAALHQDLRALAQVHLYAGTIRTQCGALRDGLARWERALALFGQLEDTKHESWCYPNMSAVSTQVGDLARAEVYGRRGIEISASVHIPDHERLAYRNMGRIALCREDWAGAVGAFSRCAQLSQDAGEPMNEAWANTDLGFVYLAQGRQSDARSCFEEAISLAGPEGWAASPANLALVLSGLERAQDPASFRALCRRICTETGDARRLFLEPIDEDSDVATVLRQEYLRKDGLDGLPGDAWQWVDPLAGSAFGTQDGLCVWAMNGSDLAGVNRSAPRMLRPGAGDLMIQTVCTVAAPDRPATGGILLWRDRTCFVLLEWGRRGAREVALEGCLGGQDLILGRGLLPVEPDGASPERVFLRIAREGEGIIALCSTDGQRWLVVGEVPTFTCGPVEAGLCAIGAIDRLVYPGAYPKGTAIRFASCSWCDRIEHGRPRYTPLSQAIAW